MLNCSERLETEEGAPSVTGVFGRRVGHHTLELRLARALATRGSNSLFAVQACVLKRAYSLHGFERDVCITAPTGSGKTLAYILPLLHILSKRLIADSPAVIVLVPSSELAVQVCAVADSFCRAVSVKISLMQHGLSNRQQRCDSFTLLRRGRKTRTAVTGFAFSRRFGFKRKVSQILVSAPGALASLQCFFSLQVLKFAVVDESDRMLQQVYQNWSQLLNQLNKQTPFKQRLVLFGQRKQPKLQCLLCSATLVMDELRRLHVYAPELINVHDHSLPHSLPSTLSEFLVLSDFSEKFTKLLSILNCFSTKKVLVFCASSTRAETLSRALSKESDVIVYEFSSRLSQSRRACVLRNFHKSKTGILIASDAATRGLHIDSVSAVISYDCPIHHKTHLHRAGRAGRAGVIGSSFTICTTSEAKKFQEVCQRTIQVVDTLRCGGLGLGSLMTTSCL